WPPHSAKKPAEPPRVQPSRSKHGKTGGGRRIPTRPLIEIGRATKRKDALEGFERWKTRHPEAAAHLRPADVLVDAMRGRSSTWTRVRVNLERVHDDLRPTQEPLDPDDAPAAPNRPVTSGPSRRSPRARGEERPRAGRSGSPPAASRDP